MARPRGIDFSEERPARLRPIEKRLPEWLWGDKARHTLRVDDQSVLLLRTVHFEAMQFVVFICQLLTDSIEAREEAASVPNLALLVPGFGRLPGRREIALAIESAPTEGLRQARFLLSEIARPAVVRFWFRRQTLTQSKARKRGTFSGRDDFTNRMRIRIPHR